jgi:type I restriction enzyme R subunit
MIDSYTDLITVSFDQYYQDVQQRIKDQKYTNTDYPRKNKIDIVIVVDMLLTGFDSKYLNTLYVDKNLQYHGLIQAFSRTNRVLNDTKPYGNILDFRYQEDAVNTAIARFSGQDKDRAKEIWLVDPAPKVIEKLDSAVNDLEKFMDSQGLSCTPENVNNLKGDAARSEFINRFKEVQRLKTQLDQYTDLNEEQVVSVNTLLPEEQLRGFRGMYLETAQRLKAQQAKGSDDPDDPVQQLEFELVLFASAVIDYDYIMGLIAKSTDNDKHSKHRMSRQQLIDLISSSANLMDERDDIVDYINRLPTDKSLNEKSIREGYQKFKAEKSAQELSAIADRHSIAHEALQDFVDSILDRMIFDGEQLSELLEPLGLGWKVRTQAELALMEELVPLLNKLAQGREVSGLAAYE